jgi:hypothetical protein
VSPHPPSERGIRCAESIRRSTRTRCSVFRRPRRAGCPWPPSTGFAPATSSAAAIFGRAAWLAGEAVSASSKSPFKIYSRSGGATRTGHRWRQPGPPELHHERPERERAGGYPRPVSARAAEGSGRLLDAPDALLSVFASVRRILTPMHPCYCPQCGERVTPYAAGCALCGADPDPKRCQKPVSARQRLSVRMPASLRLAFRGRGAVRVRGSL